MYVYCYYRQTQVDLQVKSDWWYVVYKDNGNGEGWGLINDDYAGDWNGWYLCYDGELCDHPKGANPPDRHLDPGSTSEIDSTHYKVDGVSLAAHVDLDDPNHIALDTYPVQFTLDPPPHMHFFPIYPPQTASLAVKGKVVDVGKKIGTGHIDFYMGVKDRTGSNTSNEYFPYDGWVNVGVTY